MIKVKLLRIFGLFLSFQGLLCVALMAQLNFPYQSSFKYLKGSEAASLSTTWYSVGYDDAAWSTGSAPYRYGVGEAGTVLSDMKGGYSTLFLRTKFNVQQLSLMDSVTINAKWDDGFVLFINGKQIISQQAPTVLNSSSIATALHAYTTASSFKFSSQALGLVEGENTLAVLGLNISLAGSSDFYFDMSMSATMNFPDLPELQDSLGVSFTHASGFYSSAFDLGMNTSMPEAKIIYTLDVSNPQNSTSSIIASGNVNFNVSPNYIGNLGAIPSVIVRASVVKDGYKPSKPTTRTFIYLDKVKTQSAPGGNWPTTSVNGQEIDLEMDPEVYNNSLYSNLVTGALLDIPSISLVTDNKNLFDATTGIYVNAEMQGEAWERECSVELINPDGSKGFNVNAGVRIRGGYSRKDGYPKHGFRLFFRTDYGASKLEYPLFENEGVTSFDKIDLRCEQNYAWSNSSGTNNTCVKEVFCRDSQGAMGQPYTRSRYYHLYLNGLYWGLYQTQERSEARYAESYFGGDKDDYDVIKVNGYLNYELTATDGNLDKWQKVYDYCLQGFASNANYYKLEGKDENGKPLKNSEVLVDIDNLIDYMINIFYTGNFDAPVSRFFSNLQPNNMYAIKNRNNGSQGFKFFVHDAEHTMFSLTEDRVNIATQASKAMVVTDFKYFHIQWLHYKLSENKEYQQRFADRAWKHFNANGVFTPDACLERFNKRATQIDKAIIAESVRWGDGESATIAPYTKDNAWIPALNVVRNNYFPYRISNVKSQLLNVNLYASISAPIVSQGQNAIYDEYYKISASILVNLSSADQGTIYYSLDGSDPRTIGGAVSKNALEYKSSGLQINGTSILKSRLFNGTSWSAITVVNFMAEQTDFSNFKVTELNYHPTDSIYALNDTVSGKSFEFIEFKNTSTTDALNLSGVSIQSSINYVFPENTVLAPQTYFVVASKPAKLYDRYGIVAQGNFTSNLSNSGEQVLVLDKNGSTIMDFTYSDNVPWPYEADGYGNSLVSVNANPVPSENPNDFSYWVSSAFVNGSPGKADFANATGLSKDLMDSNLCRFILFPNPTSNYFNVHSADNNSAAFTLKLYNLQGSLMLTQDCVGEVKVSMDKLNIATGVYMLQIISDTKTETRKLIYTAE